MGRSVDGERANVKICVLSACIAVLPWIVFIVAVLAVGVITSALIFYITQALEQKSFAISINVDASSDAALQDASGDVELQDASGDAELQDAWGNAEHSVECDGEWMIIYRSGHRVRPDELEGFLEETMRTLSVILGTAGR